MSRSTTVDGLHDTDAAVHFAVTRTGLDEAACLEFQRSQGLYLFGMGLVVMNEAEWLEVFEITPGELREQYADCFPQRNIEDHIVDPQLERRFIVLDTGLDEESVARLQDAENEFLRRIGLRVLVDDDNDPQPEPRFTVLVGGSTLRPVTATTQWLDLEPYADAVCWIDLPYQNDDPFKRDRG